MVKGFVVNNTGKSRHIFQRTVFPGGKIKLEEVFSLVGSKVPEGTTFESWLKHTLPNGWEVDVHTEDASLTGGREFKETMVAELIVTDTEQDLGALPTPTKIDETVSPSKEYMTSRAIDKMTATDVYKLKMKDNPKRILKSITSIHKLRRALALCKNDNRKTVLVRLLQGRIRELNVTL